LGDKHVMYFTKLYIMLPFPVGDGFPWNPLRQCFYSL